MKILAMLVVVALLSGCNPNGSSATFGPVVYNSAGQPVVGAYVQLGAEDAKPPMSAGKKIAIGAAAAGAIYAAGEEWVWGGKGGRGDDGVTTVSDEGNGNLVINNNDGGEQTIVICNDCTIEGTVN